MKKIFILILAFCMIFAMTACSTETLPVESTEKIIHEETPSPAEPEFNQVILDQDNIKITCKGFVPGSEDGWDDPEVKFLIENSSDKNIIVQVRDVSVNGFMIDPFCSEEVAAGKKMNGNMSWLQMYFDKNDIVEVETIEFYFHIFDSDSWDTIIDSDIITLNF